MRIPAVRDELTNVARRLRKGGSPKYYARRIDYLVTELVRRKASHRAPPMKRTKVTPVLRRRIIAFWRTHRTWDHQEIGNHFNVNHGRVSESVSGFRR